MYGGLRKYSKFVHKSFEATQFLMHLNYFLLLLFSCVHTSLKLSKFSLRKLDKHIRWNLIFFNSHLSDSPFEFFRPNHFFSVHCIIITYTMNFIIHHEFLSLSDICLSHHSLYLFAILSLCMRENTAKSL